MSTPTQDFVVDKDNLAQHRWVTGPDAADLPLAPGQIVAAVEKFSITANTLTYGLLGDRMGYWKFFPAAEPAHGRIPAWGFIRVVRSNDEAVAVGDRLFGFVPMSTHVVMQPENVTAMGFTDGAEHRRPLHALYNTYTRLETDPGYSADHEGVHLVFRPLFATAFLLDDLLADQGYFGAQRLLLLSASSKTALSTAFCVHQRGDRPVRIVGATSARNVAFVEGLGVYDEVVPYERLTGLDASVPTTIIDVAGNGELVETLHHHLGERVVHDMIVGKSHLEGRSAKADLPGATPAPFMAPDHARKRMAEWGAEAFGARMTSGWTKFRGSTSAWFEVRGGHGPQAVVSAYEAVRAGTVSPAEGYVVGVQAP